MKMMDPGRHLVLLFAVGVMVCVSVVADVATLLVVNASVPASTFDEFIRYAKGRPGQLNFASLGAGSNGGLTMEIFTAKSGIELVKAPAFSYLKAESLPAVLDAFDRYGEDAAMLAGGQSRLAVLSAKAGGEA